MKKLLSLTLSLLLCFSSLSLFACKQPEEGKTLTLKYSNGQAVMQMLKEGTLEYGLLPEPVATKLEMVIAPDTTWHRLDLQELYNPQTKSYPQAVLMVKNEVLDAYPQLVKQIESKFSENISWAKQNGEQVASIMKAKYDQTSLSPAKILTEKTIDNCKIGWQSALDAKNSVNAYLDDVLDISVGLDIAPAKKVEDSFFYAGSENAGESVDGKTFTFVAPDGAPALSIVKYMADNENFIEGANFDYKVVVADDIAKYMNGKIAKEDFIIMPLNAATLQHNDEYKLVSVGTHGNLYLMSKTKIDNLDALDGKTIGISVPEGKVPDLTFKAVLKNNSFKYSKVA